MTLRISICDAPAGRVLQLAGRLTREEVPELEGALEADPSPARLDLTDLLSADAEGLAALRRFREAGTEMVGTRSTLAARLEDDRP